LISSGSDLHNVPGISVFWKALFDKGSSGIAFFDSEARLIQCNQAFIDLLNSASPVLLRKELSQARLYDLLPGTETRYQEAYQNLLRGDTVKFSVSQQNESGISCLDLELIPLIENERLAGFTAAAADAGERHRVELGFVECQRRLNTMLSTLPGMAYRCRYQFGWAMEFVSQGSSGLTGYSPEVLLSRSQISYADLIHPNDRQAVWEEIQAAVNELKPYRVTYRIQAADGEEKWVWDQGQAVHDSSYKIQALEGFVYSLSERVMTQQLFTQRAEERSREFAAILEVSHSVASDLELKPLMNHILEQLKTIVDYDGAAVLVLDNNLLKILAYQGPIPQGDVLKYQFPLEKAGANREVIRLKQPMIIPDVLGNGELAQEFQKTAGDELDSTFGYVRSWLGVPLIVREQVIGMISIDHHQPDYYHTSHSRLALALANQAAVAIENAQLYASARQRADEAQTILAVQNAISSRLDAQSVLQMIADEARRLTGTEQSAVYLLDEDEFVISVTSGDVAPEMVGYRIPVEGSVAGLSVRSGKPFLIKDTEKDERVFGDIIRKVGAKCFVIVPLMSRSGPIGTITVANKYSGELGADDEWVLTMLASGAVVALENADLYREEQGLRLQADRRRRVAEGLRDILTVLNSDRPLNEVLEYIVAEASRSLDSKAAVIYRIKPGDPEYFLIEAVHNMPPGFRDLVELPLTDSEPNLSILRKEPYAIPDLSTRAARYEEMLQELPESLKTWVYQINNYFKAYLSVPLIVKEEVYGALSLYYDQPRIFSEDEIGLGVSFADQAALAIENARLRAQAATSAVASERSRLARDLHDAVTQTLFSASLIAEVLPRLWEKKPAEGQRRLQELRELTRGALAEMRTLLLELRPSALIEAETSELFRHLMEAFTGRARLPVEFTMDGDAELSAELKVALYRITQEALNNIAKHAGATQAFVSLRCLPELIELVISDDGIGFDPAAISPESLGMGIMKERADSIGARIAVTSEPSRGTEIRLVWKK
jgi:PAS domain S-box-containing protein